MEAIQGLEMTFSKLKRRMRRLLTKMGLAVSVAEEKDSIRFLVLFILNWFFFITSVLGPSIIEMVSVFSFWCFTSRHGLYEEFFGIIFL